jgi:two-component system NtrC family sensor kinase
MPDLSNSSILIVDDTEENIDILLETLGDIYDVSVATDGESALEILADDHPDLILLDILMPVIDGYEVCRRLKASEQTQNIPVIFLTALSEARDEQKGLDLGAVDYITKPINPALVRSRVKNQLELKLHRDRLEDLVNQRTEALKNAQQSLIRAARLESVGQLAAGVAHEVKNPLAIIQMGVDFLSAEKSGKNEVVDQILTDMADAVKRADTVIRGLLDYSRDSMLDESIGNINHVIERSLHLVNHEMNKRGIATQLDLSDEIPNFLMDFNKLQQVFVNIFVNSAHAMGKGGTLAVSSTVKTLSDHEINGDLHNRFKPGGELIVVAVADSGPGIKDADLERIMDPFFTTKPIGQGTGLGLSVCRNIVELHHGVFTIRNHKAGGAKVLIYIPYPESGV